MLLTAAVAAIELCSERSAARDDLQEPSDELTTDDVATAVVGLVSPSTELIVKSSSSVTTGIAGLSLSCLSCNV